MGENQVLKIKRIGPPGLCCEYTITFLLCFIQAVVYRQFTQYIGPVVRDISIRGGEEGGWRAGSNSVFLLHNKIIFSQA